MQIVWQFINYESGAINGMTLLPMVLGFPMQKEEKTKYYEEQAVDADYQQRDGKARLNFLHLKQKTIQFSAMSIKFFQCQESRADFLQN